jgi:subtilisin family serine protease
MRKFIEMLSVLTLLVVLVAPAWASPAASEPTLLLEVKEKRIFLLAHAVSAKAILQALGEKAGIKVTISGAVADHPVTLAEKGLPLASIAELLTRMGLKNHAVTFGKDGLAVFVLKEGEDKAQVVQGKTLITSGAFGVKGGDQLKGRALASTPGTKDQPTSRYLPDELLLQFQLGTQPDEIEAVLAKYHLTRLPDTALTKIGFVKTRIADGRDALAVAAGLKTERVVKTPEPNFVAMVLASTDPLYPEQWYVPASRFDQAWAMAQSTAEVVVAVIDSGLDASHPDLAGKTVTGHDFVNNDDDPADDHGHGTFVSGIIAAGANTIGIKGLCAQARIMPLKVIGPDGLGTYEDTALALIHAADHGARVINLSLGGPADSAMLGAAVDYALAHGAVVVAAGGNDGREQPVYPAAYPDVIGVAALDADNGIWSGSSSGSHIDVAAPGSHILSTGLGGGYVQASGTSAATPMVAALAALVVSERPGLASPVVARLLQQTAQDLGDPGRDPVYGQGGIDAVAALGREVEPFHDLAVRSVGVEPLRVVKGRPAFVVAEIANSGTFPEESGTVVLYQLVGKERQEIGRQEITARETTKVVFPWTPAVGKEKVRFAVTVQAATDGDAANNTVLTRPYTVSQQGNLLVLYKNEPPVHGWIALQGYNKLPKDSKQRGEFGKYLPTNADSFFYSKGFSMGFGSDWDADTNHNAATGTALIEGAWEEDLTIASDSARWQNHFWNPKAGYTVGLLGKDSSAVLTAQARFKNAVDNYTPGTEALAYYWLGRTAHLLMDMSVPAHVLIDPHPIKDGYEEYTGEHYQAIVATSPNSAIPDVEGLAYRPSYPSGEYPRLSKLFYNLAETADDYDSDDKPGHGDGINGSQDTSATTNGHGNFNHYPAMHALAKPLDRADWVTAGGVLKRKLKLGVDYEVDEGAVFGHRIYFHQAFYDSINNTSTMVKVYYTDGSNDSFLNLDELGYSGFIPTSVAQRNQQQLQARAIGYTAALYQLFWNETHPLQITKNLTLTAPGGYSEGQSISATFAIKNISGKKITLNKVTVGGRLDSVGDCANTGGVCPDFPSVTNVIIEPGKEWVYGDAAHPKSRKLAAPGNYHFFIAYELGGQWFGDWNIPESHPVTIQTSQIGKDVPTSCGLPTALTVPASDPDGSYTVSWSASPTAGVTYRLEEDTNPGFTTPNHPVYPFTANLFQPISGRALGQTYYYRVRAMQGSATPSPWVTGNKGCAVAGGSASNCTLPSQLLVPFNDPDGGYSISWAASATLGASYALQEATNPIFTTGLRTLFAGANLSQAISGRPKDRTYYYRVKAIKPGLKDSAWRLGPGGCAVPGTMTTAAPGLLTIPTTDPDGSFSVSWQASATAGASYLLEEATDSGFTSPAQVYFGRAHTRAIGGRAVGATYYYRVKAVLPGRNDSAWQLGANRCLVGYAPSSGVCPLNDTGITWYGDAYQNFLSSPPAGFEGQDADHGRDPVAVDGALVKEGGGEAGFDFTKLDPNGNELSASATTWSCVRDNHTGLTWEEKSADGGLRDQGWGYSWYNSDPASNGGAVGNLDPGWGSCGGHLDHCNTEAYAAAVNSQGLCGASDWRLPKRQELQTIVHWGRTNPSIDTTYFPHTVANWFWSSSPYAYHSDYAWSVEFYDGYVFGNYRYYDSSVRLVRGGQ